MEYLLLSNKKGCMIDISNSMDEFQNNYAECKKPDKKEYIVRNSICIKLEKCKVIHRERKHFGGYLGIEGQEGTGRRDYKRTLP